MTLLAPPERVELPTTPLGPGCSVQLSYRGIGNAGRRKGRAWAMMMAVAEELESPASGFGIRRSIQLSYAT